MIEIALALAGIIAAFFYGASRQKKIERGKDAEKYRDTRKRTDKADIGRGDPDDDDKWLRNRAKRRDL